MSALLRLFLAEPAYQALSRRYRYYERNGTSVFTSGLTCILVALSWLFLKLESPAWRNIRHYHRYWFPHIFTDRPRLADSLRYVLQSAWLILFYSHSQYRAKPHRIHNFISRLHERYSDFLKNLPQRLERFDTIKAEENDATKPVKRNKSILLWAMTIISALLAILCISQPFDLEAQFVFVVLLWSVAMVIRHIPGRLPAMMMIVLSMTISCRYMWWRYSSTLNWDDPFSLACGIILLIAETYSWIVLILGYTQTIWPLHRKPVFLPNDIEQWPTVDILVPTYDEDLSVVKPTIYAALGIDWPKEKLNIYLLDDGKRDEFKQFAESVGVRYVARPIHDFAKAGNINYTLKNYAEGEFVAIFDCDHVPTRSFLQLTVGWFFRDKKLSMVQTPHHFFSPDPFERNLGRFRKIPNEGTLFYGLVQDGNDMWDATFFCGSCAILRRSALDEIGGIAVETVTEDAHTSLKMHRKGYTSAYIRIPQAAGLATESLSAHVNQRIRWARGMVQIFRLDNPLIGKGLKLSQRLCYANAMLHFLSGIPRLIFLTAPLAFLLFHAYIIFAPGLAIALYVLPHMIHASLTNSRIQGKYRHLFWSEIYETVLAWYIARPTTVALFNPHIGKFNVTAKGGLVEDTHFDHVISRPYLILIMLNVCGLIAGVWRLIDHPSNEMLTILLNMVWVLYNLLILGGAIAVAIEAKQVRKSQRVEMAMPAVVALQNGHLYAGTLGDYSEDGIGLDLQKSDVLKIGEEATLLLKRGNQEFAFPIKVVRIFGNRVGAVLDNLSVEQSVEFIQCTFARADTWALWQDSFQGDKPVESFKDILKLGFRGYQSAGHYAPPVFRQFFTLSSSAVKWVVSLLPHGVDKSAATVR